MFSFCRFAKHERKKRTNVALHLKCMRESGLRFIIFYYLMAQLKILASHTHTITHRNGKKNSKKKKKKQNKSKKQFCLRSMSCLFSFPFAFIMEKMNIIFLITCIRIVFRLVFIFAFSFLSFLSRCNLCGVILTTIAVVDDERVVSKRNDCSIVFVVD